MKKPRQKLGSLRELPRPARSIVRVSRAGVRLLNRQVRRVSSTSHHLQHVLEWGFGETPDWYDHYLDVHWSWNANGRVSFVEHGTFGSLPIRPAAGVLELCCGDGFNTKHFYAPRAGTVFAVDYDRDVLSHARRHHSAPNITYAACDLRRSFPPGRFDNVIWDGAMYLFSETEIRRIAEHAKDALRPGGVLSGYEGLHTAPVTHAPGHVFRSKEDVVSLLQDAFAHVCAFETEVGDRRDCYFYAADDGASMPFVDGNPRFVWSHRDVAVASSRT